MKTLSIRMKADDVAEVLLYDQIGRDPFFGDGIDAAAFKEQIKAIKAKVMNLRINSPGGSVFEAAAMLAALDAWKGRIEVDVDGLAASAASVVAMGGDSIRMATNAMMMIHNPWGSVLGGTAEDMRSAADRLDKVRDQILNAYERKSKAGRANLSAWMDAETWFTGQEAVEAGLAHEVSEPARVAACAAPEVLVRLGYKKVPEAVLKNTAAEAERLAEETRKRRLTVARLLST
jgi:ATP-dependent Clp protease, protease subunit